MGRSGATLKLRRPCGADTPLHLPVHQQRGRPGPARPRAEHHRGVPHPALLRLRHPAPGRTRPGATTVLSARVARLTSLALDLVWRFTRCLLARGWGDFFQSTVFHEVLLGSTKLIWVLIPFLRGIAASE